MVGNISLRDRNGKQIHFWLDYWIPKFPKLEDYAVVEILLEEKNLTISNSITPSEPWDVILFLGKFLVEICDCILAMAPSNTS